jgi:hypothetical protein
MNQKWLGIFFFLWCVPVAIHAQSIISGRVLDSITENPLAFVNIRSIDNAYLATTDIDGNFTAKAIKPIQSLKLDYMGYFPKTYDLTGETTQLTIFLQRQNIELSGVEIYPQENPANAIIRKAIANKKLNDPENIPSFKYKTYNKVIAEWYLDKTKYTISNGYDYKLRSDSTFLRLKSRAGENHLMIMESYTERIFLNGQSQETVLGSKVSGFKNPNFTTLATDIQPFSFYGDFITLTLTDVKDYINPLSNGSIDRYNFHLQDTLYVGADSVFVISFSPMKGKNFNALTGVLYINSNRYAIQNVIAQPVDDGLWTIRIQQMYVFTAGKYWFPEQLNYDWILPNYPSEKVGVVIHGNSYISGVDFNPGNKNRDFGPGNLIFADGAGIQDENFWKQHRADSLTTLESRTYVKIDSLGKKQNFTYIARFADKILKGYIPLSVLDISLENLFNYNNIEGIRAGWGMYTNEKIARWFTLGGYVGYGFWDKRWKYGGKLNFTISKKHEIKLGINYTYDLETPGMTELHHYLNYSYWNNYLINHIDLVEKYSAYVSLRTLRYLQFELRGTKESCMPQYGYHYREKIFGVSDSNTYRFTELGAGFRYAYKEKLIDAFNDRYSLGTKYPVLYLSYIHGFSGLLGGEYDYNKIELALEKNFQTRYFGKTDIGLEAGYLWNTAPLMKLFNGKGSFSSSFVLYFRNTFQTMRVDEFLYNRYVSLQLKHNFGPYLFHIKKFRPEISLTQGYLLGDLSHRDWQRVDDEFRVPDHGYFESGVIFDNLVRLRLLNLAYLKIGFGVFYRYGYYAFDHELKNFAVKFSFKLSGNK